MLLELKLKCKEMIKRSPKWQNFLQNNIIQTEPAYI